MRRQPRLGVCEGGKPFRLHVGLPLPAVPFPPACPLRRPSGEVPLGSSPHADAVDTINADVILCRRRAAHDSFLERERNDHFLFQCATFRSLGREKIEL